MYSERISSGEFLAAVFTYVLLGSIVSLHVGHQCRLHSKGSETFRALVRRKLQNALRIAEQHIQFTFYKVTINPETYLRSALQNTTEANAQRLSTYRVSHIQTREQNLNKQVIYSFIKTGDKELEDYLEEKT